MATRDANGWDENDYAALLDVAENQKVPPTWILASMLAESDLNPRSINSRGYRGLIQFGRQRLVDYGLSDQQIANFTNLTPAQQMPYVDRFLRGPRPSTGWISRAQIQQGIFVPATIKIRGSAPEAIIASRTDPIKDLRDAYEANQIFDVQNKGYIQVQDLENRLQKVIINRRDKWNTALTGLQRTGASSVSNAFTNVGYNTSTTFTSPSRSPLVAIVAGLVLAGGAYYIYQQQNMFPKRGYA